MRTATYTSNKEGPQISTYTYTSNEVVPNRSHKFTSPNKVILSSSTFRQRMNYGYHVPKFGVSDMLMLNCNLEDS